MSEPTTYPGHRFPAEIIHHAVWLYHVFSLSLRDVELIFAERGITVAHESIRRWCLKFGHDFASRLRRRRPRPGDTRHLDEVFLRIGGTLYYLWRAVDQHGVVLDILVQGRRNATAAKHFLSGCCMGSGTSRGAWSTMACVATVRQSGRSCRGAAPDQPLPEQPGGELPQADASAREANAAIQVSRAGAAVPLGACIHL
nr:IS6 family transposase [Siccirubricoccus deserti]